MKRFIYTLQHKASQLLLLSILACSTSCNSVLNYDEGDCSIEYRVRFKYDYNMKYANAFANEVERVTLYAFDKEGKFVYLKTDEGQMLKSEDYTMKVDIDPGEYRLIAWAGLTNESYAIPLLAPGISDIEELTVKTNRITQTRAANGEPINLVSEKLASLWHGECTQTLTRAGQQKEIVVSLVKDTNSFRIVLQQMQGKSLNADMFEFSIFDDNGWLNYDNSLLADKMLTYQPHFRTAGSVTRADGGDTTPVSVVVAEITVNRLIADKNPRLRITNKETGAVVLSIPLVDYLLLTQQEGHKDMTPQEYLDRQDEYSLTFFLDENTMWLNTEIIINGWTIRNNSTDL